MPVTPMLLHWRFGPDWPGRRCGAKTRRGTLCQKPALRGRPRCKLHGGLGGAPRGPKNGNYKHGRHTKKAQAEAREARARLRELERLGRRLGLFQSEADARLASKVTEELFRGIAYRGGRGMNNYSAKRATDDRTMFLNSYFALRELLTQTRDGTLTPTSAGVLLSRLDATTEYGPEPGATEGVQPITGLIEPPPPDAIRQP